MAFLAQIEGLVAVELALAQLVQESLYERLRNDPAAAQGSAAEVALAFADAYRMLNNRITLFTSLPILLLSRLTVFDGTPVHIIALGLACIGIVLYYAAFVQYLKTAISGRARPAATTDIRAS